MRTPALDPLATKRTARLRDNVDLAESSPENRHHHESDNDVNEAARHPPGHSGDHIGATSGDVSAICGGL